MIPHTLVLEPGLRVYKIYNGYWFFGRPTVEELRLDLRAVLQRCRPDWDISSAEQRTAWAKGDKAGFYPYGKTRAQVLAEPDDPSAMRSPARPRAVNAGMRPRGRAKKPDAGHDARASRQRRRSGRRGSTSHYLRSDRKPARTSSEKSCGCSQAAKCPPLSSLL